MDYGCELGDPIPPASCNGVMVTLSTICSMIGLAIGGVSLSQKYPYNSNEKENNTKLVLAFGLALVAMLMIGLILGFLVGKRLRREREKIPKLLIIPVIVMGLTELDTDKTEEHLDKVAPKF